MVNEPDEPLHEIPPPATPPATLPSPQHATPSLARGSPSSGERSSCESSVQRGPIKMRSIREIYEHIEEDAETNFFCLFADHEPLTFQESKKEDCWRLAMKEEMHAIQRNDTWELTTLPQNHKAIGVK